MSQTKNSIDIVILWAGEDGSTDPLADNTNRRRNNQELRFLLRSLENLKDFRKIYLVLDEPAPEWLDNTRISIVRHEDFLPLTVARPCHNSTLLQCYVHNIDGLSENYLLFDDDFCILKPISAREFFPDFGKMKVILSDSSLEVTPQSFLDNSYSYFLSNTSKLLPRINKARKASWHHLKPQKVTLSRETFRLFEKDIKVLDHMQHRSKSASLLFYELTYHTLNEKLIDIEVDLILEHHTNFPPMLMCNLLDSYEETRKSFENLLSVSPTFLCVNDDMGKITATRSVEFYQELMVSLFPDKSIFELECVNEKLVSDAATLIKRLNMAERDQAISERDQAISQIGEFEKAFFWRITWIPRKVIETIRKS